MPAGLGWTPRPILFLVLSLLFKRAVKLPLLHCIMKGILKDLALAPALCSPRVTPAGWVFEGVILDDLGMFTWL